MTALPVAVLVPQISTWTVPTIKRDKTSETARNRGCFPWTVHNVEVSWRRAMMAAQGGVGSVKLGSRIERIIAGIANGAL